jgi:purine-binding chemotaxis protein CheW
VIDTDEQRFVSFRLGGKLFGIDIRQVKEVSTPPPMTPVPLAPAAVRGYVNLRGHVHLVLDLNRVLGAGATELGPDTRLVLFKPALGDPFGVLVDRIGDIVSLHPDQVEAGDEEDGGLVRGIGKLDGELLVLVDARRLLPFVERQLQEGGRG